MPKARISSKDKRSPFKMQVGTTPRGVFFDRIDGTEKLLVLHTTPGRARALATWILENVHE